MCSSMIASVRSMAGLGSPPKSFTTNNNESLNNLLKQKLITSEMSGLLLINCSESSVNNSKESVRRLYLVEVSMS